jgi:hypothetical protein
MITANGEEQSGLCSTNSHEESAKHGLYIIYFEMCEQGSNLLSQYLNPLPAKCK